MRLQATVGNRATTETVVQREASRAEMIAAYDAAVSKGDWAQAAIRLNGFNKDDIIELTKKLEHWQRVSIATAVRIRMPGWPDYVIPIIRDNVDKDIEVAGTLPTELPALRARRLELEKIGPGTEEERVKIRHKLMEMVAELQDTLPANRKADDPAETAVAAKQGVILGELRNATLKPEFDHTNRAIQDKVLAALQLQIKMRGLDSVGQQDARAKWGISDADWCGEFAYTKARSVGLDPTRTSGAVSYHQHVDQLERLFTYQDEPTWVWDQNTSTWRTLKDYHLSREALRKYWVLPAPGGSDALVKPLEQDKVYRNWFKQFHLEDYYDTKGNFTPRPGDIVLKDNHGNVRPDHITTAISYSDTDESLRTVGGNEGGGQGGVKQSKEDYHLDKNAAPAVGDKKEERIYAIGRWSVVDFETHIYAHGKMPSAPPGKK